MYTGVLEGCGMLVEVAVAVGVLVKVAAGWGVSVAIRTNSVGEAVGEGTLELRLQAVSPNSNKPSNRPGSHDRVSILQPPGDSLFHIHYYVKRNGNDPPLA